MVYYYKISESPFRLFIFNDKDIIQLNSNDKIEIKNRKISIYRNNTKIISDSVNNIKFEVWYSKTYISNDFDITTLVINELLEEDIQKSREEKIKKILCVRQN